MPASGLLASANISVRSSKLFRDLVDRAGDQGFCRNTGIALAQRMFRYRLCLGRRFAEVNIGAGIR
jgi:hypothetical protein